MKRFKLIAAALATSAVFAVPGLAGAYSIIKVADTNTPIPGGTGTFTHFDQTSGGFFIGEGSGAQKGIYSFRFSALAKLVNTGEPAPGIGADFRDFVSVSDGELGTSFVATTTDGQQAVYVQWGGVPTPILIARSGQSPAAGITVDTFTSVSSTYQDNAELNPTGEFLSDAGIYGFFVTDQSSLSPPYSSYSVGFTQEASTAPPSTFSSLGEPNFKAGFPGGGLLSDSTIQTMRATANGEEGIYYSPLNGPSSGPNPFSKLVDTDTTVPGGAGTFTSFADPTANEINLVFTAHYNVAGEDEQGIFDLGPYAYPPPPSALQELLSAGSSAPNSGGAHFKDFLGVTPFGTFLADLDNGTEGIYSLQYLYNNNSPDKIGDIVDIIDTTDSLDGKTIKNFELSREADMMHYPEGVSAFIVNFTDGSQGLYYFAVPEPASLALLPLALLFIRRHRNTA